MKPELVTEQKRVAYKDVHTLYVSVDKKVMEQNIIDETEQEEFNRNIEQENIPIDPKDRDTVEV